MKNITIIIAAILLCQISYGQSNDINDNKVIYPNKESISPLRGLPGLSKYSDNEPTKKIDIEPKESTTETREQKIARLEASIAESRKPHAQQAFEEYIKYGGVNPIKNTDFGSSKYDKDVATEEIETIIGYVFVAIVLICGIIFIRIKRQG